MRKIQSELGSDVESCTEMMQPSYDVTSMSEMPCHLIGDVHEGRNEVPTVPVRSPLKPPSGAKAREV